MNTTPAACGFAAAIAALLPGLSGAQSVGMPTQTVDILPETEIQEHATTDYGTLDSDADDRDGTTLWRVVKDTGNCCENHLTTSQGGRLFDLGGSYVNYTDDRGATWKSVQPLTPLVNGEGSVTMAPNGDVLAIEWDPYTGDHLIAYKYDASTQEWLMLENVLHHPFYDRPWISVVPGPFNDILGNPAPYVAFVQGGYPLKDPMFVSTDGLNYYDVSSLTVDGIDDTPVETWFPIQADASFDWIQPIQDSPVTGLGAGRAAAGGGWLLDPADQTWDSWRLPGGAMPPSFIQVDSIGRVHHVRSVAGAKTEYRISTDSGQTWTSTIFDYPLGGLADFRANNAVGIAAVGTRVNNQDWVYKLDITGDTARLLRAYHVGLGDTPAGVGLGVLPEPRYDFKTIAIFDDGRVAVSFLDSSTLSHPPGTGVLGRITPAVAIELDTTLPDLCPTDPFKETPGQCGCGVPDVDSDGDGAADCVDNCLTAVNAGQEDAEGDGVGDACDNCILVANADQCDTNGDGYGNACDPDLNDNGVVNFVDLGLMKDLFLSNDPDADLTCNGVVNFPDLAIMKAMFFGPPGPSAFAPE